MPLQQVQWAMMHFIFAGTYKVRIQGVTNYNNIINNLSRIFDVAEGLIEFCISVTVT